MNNLVSPDGASQTLHLSLIRLSSTSLPTLMLFFFTTLQNLLFLSSTFTMATRVISLYALENIIWSSEATVGWWADRLVGRVSGGQSEEKTSGGEWKPLGRASTLLTYLDLSDRPLLLLPQVLQWNISHLRVHLLMEGCSRCWLHITISNGSCWNLPWCVCLLEINMNVGYRFSRLIWAVHNDYKSIEHNMKQ